ncbi:MAG TPA: hypothetical protein VE978_23140 [Chitinophagales bacterium]|nr:hypothetical protein [Chitinophagales bacterium]
MNPSINTHFIRQLLRVLVLLMSLTSCSESFQTLDPKNFNEKIAGRTDIKTSEELITLFYDWPDSEEKPKLTIKTDKLEGNSYEITLIHEELEDDSQSGEKIVMKAKLNGRTWIVTEIKKNWKCWSGRGQTNWGTELCD